MTRISYVVLMFLCFDDKKKPNWMVYILKNLSNVSTIALFKCFQHKFMIDSLSAYSIYSLDKLISFAKCIT